MRASAYAVIAWTLFSAAAPPVPAESGPSAAGFALQLRDRVATAAGGSSTKPRFREAVWDPAHTAVIVCDMWDSHHSPNAVKRVKDIAPRMNEVIKAARRAGALIIHAPSSCMDAYADHPARRRALEAPAAEKHPPGIDQWNHKIASEEDFTYPIDQSDGGEDDDPDAKKAWSEKLASSGLDPSAPWKRQIDVLDIEPTDALTDKGSEVWNLLEARGVENVIFLGVHTNMCVLGRPFGLRQLASNGLNVALVRDLTDTMYNPAMWPQVSHHTGTDFIIEYIESCVCPTILSTDLIGGVPHRFFDDRRPTVAVVISEFEYETYKTLPEFARAQLGKDFRVVYAINDEKDNHELPGIEVLREADLAILSIWRRTLPAEQLEVVRDYVAGGKPIVAVRTSSHAFAARDDRAPAGRALWPEFDREVLNVTYTGHHGNHADQGDPPTHVWVHPAAADHALAAGLPSGEFVVGSWLYKLSPLIEPARPILLGRVGDHAHEPVASIVERSNGQRVFYTSLGSQGDFEQPEFRRLLRNAIYWSLRLPSATDRESAANAAAVN